MVEISLTNGTTARTRTTHRHREKRERERHRYLFESDKRRLLVVVLCVHAVCRWALLLGMFWPGPERRGQGVREWRFVRVMRASSSSSGIWGDGFQAENARMRLHLRRPQLSYD